MSADQAHSSATCGRPERGVALATGATGFVGRVVAPALAADGWRVTRGVRRPTDGPEPQAELGELRDWSTPTGRARLADALQGVDLVVHLAARVHRMRDDAADPAAAHRSENRDATAALAEAAREAGVARCILMSSVKVLGEGATGRALTDADPTAPADPYATAKAEAEAALFAAAGDATIAVALRPPLVYGPGVGANFARLMRLADAGAPLPLASVRNARSLIYVGNLADAVRAAASAPAEPVSGRRFLVSDGEDLSTPEILRRLAAALGRPSRLLPAPPAALRIAARATGRTALADRLLGDLIVDASGFRAAVGWRPPYTVDEGFAATAAAYAAAKKAAA